jgi:UDP-2,3-diacylglucosamine pyrophosphatase LpxH
MRIAITSDSHFGDRTSQLATLDSKGKPILGPKYEQFKNAVGQNNNYLVMLGDVIDMAIEDYKDAYDVAEIFFKQVAADNIADRILYVPGNHDYDLWHTVEYQANIIKRVTDKPKKNISLFKMSVPAVLDDRPGREKIYLGNVTRRTEPGKPYGGLFLDFLVDEKLEFYVAFPNVYLITDENECILLTHGQYFQFFWSLISEWAPKIFGEDIKTEIPLIIKNVAHLNFPLSQLSSSGVGQAGPLTDVIRQIQYDFKDQEPERIMKYVDNLERALKSYVFKFKWYKPCDWLKKLAMSLAKKELKKWIEKRPITSPREDEEWEYKPDTNQKMVNYYKSSQVEINSLNEDNELDIPAKPNKIIFGHSHRPIGLKESKRLIIKPLQDSNLEVPLFNTGGWLIEEKDGKKAFDGIEIFTYETRKGINSVSISD